MRSFRFKLGLLLAIVAGASFVSQFVYRNIVTSLHGSLFESVGTLETVHAAETFHSALHSMLDITASFTGNPNPLLEKEYRVIRKSAEEVLSTLINLIGREGNHDQHLASGPPFVRFEEIRPFFEGFKNETDAVFSDATTRAGSHLEKARVLFDKIFEEYLNVLHTNHQARLDSLLNDAHDLNKRVDLFFFIQIAILSASTLAALVFSDRVLLKGFRTAERGALSDGLTGLRNRRYLEGPVMTQIVTMLRDGMSFSLVLADIDHFKVFNDSFGHQAGDAALKQVAEQLRNGLRKTDTIIRYGGEEFLMILPGADKASALATTEKIRERIAINGITLEAEHNEKVTASFGLASFPEDKLDDFASLLRKADKRLYAAKRDGRNRVVT